MSVTDSPGVRVLTRESIPDGIHFFGSGKHQPGNIKLGLGIMGENKNRVRCRDHFPVR